MADSRFEMDMERPVCCSAGFLFLISAAILGALRLRYHDKAFIVPLSTFDDAASTTGVAANVGAASPCRRRSGTRQRIARRQSKAATVDQRAHEQINRDHRWVNQRCVEERGEEIPRATDRGGPAKHG